MGTPIDKAFGKGTSGASSPTTTKGDLIARGASADERLAIGNNGWRLVADSAEATGMKWEPETPIDPAPNPLNTKGDVYGFSFEAKRIPVGTNDQVLTADSTNALGVAWKTPAGGGSASVLFDVTLVSASQTIGIGALGNLTEFDFEIYVPPVVTVVNLLMYVNGDTTAANYRTQSLRSFDITEEGTEFDDSHVTFVREAGPTLILGKARLVDGHFTCMTQSVAQQASTQTNIKYAGQYRELTDTDLDAISFDTGSGVNVLPIGTRLIIRDPAAVGATGATGATGDNSVQLGRFSPPLAADFPTSVGIVGAVLTDDDFEGLLFHDATTDGAGAGKVQGRFKPIPSGAWTATARLDINYDPDNFNSAGMLVRDSATGKTVQLRFSPATATIPFVAFVSRYTGDTFNSDSITALNQSSKMTWFRIEDDTVNLLFSISHDGVNFHQIHSESRTAHTANLDQLGFFVNPSNDAPISLICTYWNDKDTIASPTAPAALTTLDIGVFVAGVLQNSERVLSFVANKAFTLPIALAGSIAFAEVVSTAAATLDVQVNGVSKGSINFALGVATATFTFAAPVVVAVGDRLQLVGQGAADATLADIAITLRGNI